MRLFQLPRATLTGIFDPTQDIFLRIHMSRCHDFVYSAKKSRLDITVEGLVMDSTTTPGHFTALDPTIRSKTVVE